MNHIATIKPAAAAPHLHQFWPLFVPRPILTKNFCGMAARWLPCPPTATLEKPTAALTDS
jgi:hypothetical protein